VSEKRLFHTLELALSRLGERLGPVEVRYFSSTLIAVKQQSLESTDNLSCFSDENEAEYLIEERSNLAFQYGVKARRSKEGKGK
jgi:hypothetical protein